MPTIYQCRVCITYFMVVTIHYWAMQFGFGHSYIRSSSNLLKIGTKGRYLQALWCPIMFQRFRVINSDVQNFYIGIINFTLNNRSGPVFSRQPDRLGPVLLGPVGSTQYMGRSRTGCGPRLPVLGAKNRTEPDLRTLLMGLRWRKTTKEESRPRLQLTPELEEQKGKEANMRIQKPGITLI